MRRPFMTNELAIIRRHFPDGGSKACAPLLNGRSELSIRLFAWKQGIRRNVDKLNEVRRSYLNEINAVR